jgi:hypothetical protein
MYDVYNVEPAPDQRRLPWRLLLSNTTGRPTTMSCHVGGGGGCSSSSRSSVDAEYVCIFGLTSANCCCVSDNVPAAGQAPTTRRRLLLLVDNWTSLFDVRRHVYKQFYT